MKGEKKASEMAYETIEGSKRYLNTEVAKKLGIEIPDGFADEAEVFDAISES